MSDEAAVEAETDEHVRPDQLFALLWANQDKRTPAEGEELDAELKRMFDDMDEERFSKGPPVQYRLGPETAARLWEHSLACETCRLQLVEDGPSARPPKTDDQIAQEIEDKDAVRRGKVIKFWKDLVIGSIAFGGAFWCMQTIRNKELVGPDGPVMQGVGPKEIDPLWYAFVVAILIASWFLAEAYVVARDLWIDFSAWKRAVPVIGKKWADRDKKKDQLGG